MSFPWWGRCVRFWPRNGGAIGLLATQRIAVPCVRAAAVLLVVAAAMTAAMPGPARAQDAVGTKTGNVTGLPIPRYVSLKASKTNLRQGPGTTYPTAWVFQQAGLPVEVTAEYEAWRRVRDADGTEGWVLRTLLSGRRTAQIAPWDARNVEERPRVTITARASSSSRTVVLVEAGVVADIRSCDGRWCDISVGAYRGYVLQSKLWGVRPGEVIK